jgi:sRNA-binding regulator protein Hfq
MLSYYSLFSYTEKMREEFLNQLRIERLQYTQFLVGEIQLLSQVRVKITLQNYFLFLSQAPVVCNFPTHAV